MQDVSGHFSHLHIGGDWSRSDKSAKCLLELDISVRHGHIGIWVVNMPGDGQSREILSIIKDAR